MSRFRRRLMALSAIRKAFRDDYIDCDWIENTSTAYINSGIYLATTASNYRIEADIMQTQAAPSSGMAIFGRKEKNYASTVSGNRGFVYYIKYNSTDAFHSELQRTTNRLTTVTPELNKKYHIKGNIKTMTVSFEEIDEETGEVVTKSYSHTNADSSMTIETYPIYIFNTYQPSLNNNLAFRGRMYSFKIVARGELVRDYVPKYRISTDEYGFWDNVEGKFYTSPNGVKFTGSLHFVNDDIRQMMVSLYGNTTADSITYAQMQTGIPTDNILIFCKKNLEWVNVPTSFDRNTKIYGIRTTETEKQADCTIRFYYNGTTRSLGLYVWYKRWGYANGSTSGYNEIQEVWKSYGGYWNTFGKDSYSTPRGVKYFSFWTVNGFRPAQYSASMVQALVVVEE